MKCNWMAKHTVRLSADVCREISLRWLFSIKFIFGNDRGEIEMALSLYHCFRLLIA